MGLTVECEAAVQWVKTGSAQLPQNDTKCIRSGALANKVDDEADLLHCSENGSWAKKRAFGMALVRRKYMEGGGIRLWPLSDFDFEKVLICLWSHGIK